jgi:GT2 family glycosyltransferase
MGAGSSTRLTTEGSRTVVVVLNWNGWALTRRCLESIWLTNEASDVWLVDNGSDEDHTPEMESAFPGLRVLRWPENFGYAGGYNRALRVAVAEGFAFAYLLNNDTTVRPGYLRSIVHAAESDPRLAIIGSWLVYQDDREQWVEFDGERWDPGVRPYRIASGLKAVETVLGAAMLIRLSAVIEQGGFDERFFCYWEEFDLCERLQRKGWGVAACADSAVVHYGGGSDVACNRQYYLTRNRFLMLQQRSDPPHQRRAVLYHAAVMADEARRNGRIREWMAYAAAVDDGLGGRFGKRRGRSPRLRAVARLIFLTLAAHITDKWRALHHRAPGWND